MSEMRDKVMKIRWWALNQACDIANSGRCPSRDDIVMMYKLVDILKDTHEIENLAMHNAELAEHAVTRMCEMHPGFGMPAGHHEHEAAQAAKA
ncbi:hypothetical protein [Desulfovibrio sp.]|uniref:hypothetical protein n=1 Tax=Desulfovibrio sp. TaxID=885 RepID=UPI003FF05BA4